MDKALRTLHGFITTQTDHLKVKSIILFCVTVYKTKTSFYYLMYSLDNLSYSSLVQIIISHQEWTLSAQSEHNFQAHGIAPGRPTLSNQGRFE